MGISVSQVHHVLTPPLQGENRRPFGALLLGALVAPTLLYVAASIFLATLVVAVVGAAAYAAIWLYQASARRFARPPIARDLAA
jgi:hypothetical protein